MSPVIFRAGSPLSLQLEVTADGYYHLTRDGEQHFVLAEAEALVLVELVKLGVMVSKQVAIVSEAAILEKISKARRGDK